MKASVIVATAVLFVGGMSITAAASAKVGTRNRPPQPSVQSGRALAPSTRFYVPPPAQGSVLQILKLATHGDFKDAALISGMEATPQAVWFDGTTLSKAEQKPAQVEAQVRLTMFQADLEHSVPVLVPYNIPGRDCSQYSAGGALTDADYQAWISGFAQGIGNGKAVVILEPDSLANEPSDCAIYGTASYPFTDAERLADINYAVNALEADPNVSVFLDGGHSAWQNVGTMADTLIGAGVGNAQGFYLDVSNYQFTQNNVFYGTWVSDCIAYATVVEDATTPAEVASATGSCPNQYWNGGPANGYVAPSTFEGGALSPYGIWSNTANNGDFNTDGETSWYASLLGTVAPTTHFVIDTSRNGTGPNDMETYAAAPYDQDSGIIGTLESGNWCNPPGAGLGLRPTADTSSVSPLLDAYLWVKTPGQSDGQCDSAGGVRAWNDSEYTPPIANWPSPSSSNWTTFDPLWSLQTNSVFTDPAAGDWFPQQALQLAQDASPPLG
jgi:endoglucanase